jgi:hypothetical protein
MTIRFFAIALVLAAADALAGENKSKVWDRPVDVDTRDGFAITARQVRENMKAGGRYEFVRTNERKKIEKDLDTISGLLLKAGSVAAMSQPESASLFNAQEHLNAVLTRNDSNRLICEQGSSAGASIVVTTCTTLGEIENNRMIMQKLSETTSVVDVCENPRTASIETVVAQNRWKPYTQRLPQCQETIDDPHH